MHITGMYFQILFIIKKLLLVTHFLARTWAIGASEHIKCLLVHVLSFIAHILIALVEGDIKNSPFRSKGHFNQKHQVRVVTKY